MAYNFLLNLLLMVLHGPRINIAQLNQLRVIYLLGALIFIRVVFFGSLLILDLFLLFIWTF